MTKQRLLFIVFRDNYDEYPSSNSICFISLSERKAKAFIKDYVDSLVARSHPKLKTKKRRDYYRQLYTKDYFIQAVPANELVLEAALP